MSSAVGGGIAGVVACAAPGAGGEFCVAPGAAGVAACALATLSLLTVVATTANAASPTSQGNIFLPARTLSPTRCQFIVKISLLRPSQSLRKTPTTNLSDPEKNTPVTRTLLL